VRRQDRGSAVGRSGYSARYFEEVLRSVLELGPGCEETAVLVLSNSKRSGLAAELGGLLARFPCARLATLETLETAAGHEGAAADADAVARSDSDVHDLNLLVASDIHIASGSRFSELGCNLGAASKIKLVLGTPSNMPRGRWGGGTGTGGSNVVFTDSEGQFNRTQFQELWRTRAAVDDRI
jgi:hypothetical protein